MTTGVLLMRIVNFKSNSCSILELGARGSARFEVDSMSPEVHAGMIKTQVGDEPLTCIGSLRRRE
jgi:hypothetical protein